MPRSTKRPELTFQEYEQTIRNYCDPCAVPCPATQIAIPIPMSNPPVSGRHGHWNTSHILLRYALTALAGLHRDAGSDSFTDREVGT